MKVSACEINVNAIDNTRMDLVITGEQHMYLRAASSQERQKWLVALGSAKACVRTYTDVCKFKTLAGLSGSKPAGFCLFCSVEAGAYR